METDVRRENDVDSTALRYFSAVAREGAVHAAAAALNVAASAISRQIAGLESEIGQPLFERHARGMRLTPAGEILARHARRLDLETERVIADIRRLVGEESAILRIDTVEGLAQYVVPEAIARLHAERPGVTVRVAIPGTRFVPQRVRAGEVDIGITFALTPEPEIRVIRRFDGSIMAFATPDHPIARKREVAIADLGQVPLFLMDVDTTVRQLFDMACAQEGVAVSPALICNSSSTVRYLTLAGGGVSIASHLTMANIVAQGRLVALPIRHPVLQQRTIQVQALAGRRLPEIVEVFLTCLDGVIAECEAGAGKIPQTSRRR